MILWLDTRMRKWMCVDVVCGFMNVRVWRKKNYNCDNKYYYSAIYTALRRGLRDIKKVHKKLITATLTQRPNWVILKRNGYKNI